jgi:hypothetical protein
MTMEALLLVSGKMASSTRDTSEGMFTTKSNSRGLPLKVVDDGAQHGVRSAVCPFVMQRQPLI